MNLHCEWKSIQPNVLYQFTKTMVQLQWNQSVSTVHGQADVVFSSSVVRPVHPYRACSSSPDPIPRKKTGGHLLFSILRYITRSVICSDICVLFFATCYLMVQGICYIKQGFCTCKLDDYVSIVLVQHIRTDTLHCSPSLVVDLQTCINFIYQLESSPDPSMLFILFDILCLQHGQSRFYTCTVYIYLQYMLYNIRPYIRFCVGIQRKKPASALPHIALTNAPLLRDGTKVHSLRC